MQKQLGVEKPYLHAKFKTSDSTDSVAIATEQTIEIISIISWKNCDHATIKKQVSTTQEKSNFMISSTASCSSFNYVL
jgi:hypothetical protein